MAFRDRLDEGDPEPSAVFFEWLDVDRFPDPAYAAELEVFLGAKFREQPPDVIATFGDVATRFAVANLISVPFQNNWDFGIGEKDVTKYYLNIQPVIPFALSGDWNLITRTIVPVVSFPSPAEGLDGEAGLGDIVQSFFFSSKDEVGGWILGAGPVFLYPSASADLLGLGKWGAGPTVVALQQRGPWTYGGLANHFWSFAGDEDRGDVSATFLNPFAS